MTSMYETDGLVVDDKAATHSLAPRPPPHEENKGPPQRRRNVCWVSVAACLGVGVLVPLIMVVATSGGAAADEFDQLAIGGIGGIGGIAGNQSIGGDASGLSSDASGLSSDAAGAFAAALDVSAEGPSVRVSSALTFDGEIVWIPPGSAARAEFEAGFAVSVAGSLGDGSTMPPERVVVDEIRAGSVEVLFHIVLPASVGTTGVSLIQALRDSGRSIEV
jgi:hypothetical protein